MLAEERRFQIREILAAQRTVSASELCELLKVTPATIRRDLAALQQEGVLLGPMVERFPACPARIFNLPMTPCSDQQRRETPDCPSGREARVGWRDDLPGRQYDSVRAGATAGHRRRLTVVTNSPTIVCELQRSTGVTVLCTGGDLQKDTFYLSGEWAQRALSEMRLDKAILGVSAIDPQYGISTASHAEAQIKKMLTKAAKARIALADHGKFGKQSFAFVGPVTDIDILVTDSGTDAQQIRELRDAGVQVVIAEAGPASPKVKERKKSNK